MAGSLRSALAAIAGKKTATADRAIRRWRSHVTHCCCGRFGFMRAFCRTRLRCRCGLDVRALIRERKALPQIDGFQSHESSRRALLASVRTSGSGTEHALSVLLQNRMNHGGILAPGAGLLRIGEAGRGLRSRWYPQTLATRLNAIHELKDRRCFSHTDGFGLLASHKEQKTTVAFVDPSDVVND